MVLKPRGGDIDGLNPTIPMSPLWGLRVIEQAYRGLTTPAT